MSWDFDLEAAINKIAELEAAIATPAPGIVTAFSYNANPTVITDPALLPAVVHVPQGPNNVQELSTGAWSMYFEIYSRLLIVESIEGDYPADEAGASLFWQPVAETFLNRANRMALCAAAGALDYQPIFEGRSFAPRYWPPVEKAPNSYWSLQYTHRFLIYGG